MIEIFLFLLFSETCDINISAGIGAKFYHINTKDNYNICFNIRTYPFFIIFNEFENTVIYQQYSSSSVDAEYTKTEESLLRFLPVYKMMASAFEFVVLKTPTASNLSFTIASLPGMCLNGLYLSNRKSDMVLFSKYYDDETKFFKLNEYDDKCLIYSTPFVKQHVKVAMTSDNITNQVFLYSGYHNYTSIYGNASIEQITGQNPIIVNNNNNHNINKNIFVQPNTAIKSNLNPTIIKNATFNSENNLNEMNNFDLYSGENQKSNLNTIKSSNFLDYSDNQDEGPIIIRIIADPKCPPSYVNVTFITEDENVTQKSRLNTKDIKVNHINELLQDDWNEGRSGMYLPPQKIESCLEKKTWYSKNVAIILIVVLFVLFMIFVFIITSNVTKNNEEESSDLINDRPDHFNTDLNETSSLSSFMNAPVLKTLVS